MILAHRLWQGAAGLVTMLLIARFLTIDQQGLYYSFLTITSPYLFDLGLSTVALQNAAFLKGSVSGQSVASVRRHMTFQWLLYAMRRWYYWMGLVSVLVLYPIGYWIFNKSDISVSWEWQWIVLVPLSGFALYTIPQLCIIEGLGRVSEVYRVRLVQSVLAALSVWGALLADAGLWVVVVTPLVTFIVNRTWIQGQPLLSVVSKKSIESTTLLWRSEIWPMQWRIGITLLSGFLLTQIFTPILLYYQGPKVAGQFGLSLAIANTVGLIAQSWLVKNIPAMGTAAAAKNWASLDQLFRRSIILSTSFLVVGALMTCLARIMVMNTYLGERILPLGEFIILFGIVFGNHVMGCLAAQMRSFRQEPLMWVALAGAVIALPAGIVATQHWSSYGLVVSLCSINLLMLLPLSVYLWRTCNQRWRG